MKAYIDGDDELPTICGTGLEDYVGSAWGMGAVRLALQRRAAAGEGGRGARRSDREGNPDLARLLPVARARPDHVRARPEGDDPADRLGVLRRRPGGRARGVREDEPGRRRGLEARHRRACTPGASPSGSTTTAPRRTSTAPGPRRWPGSTWRSPRRHRAAALRDGQHLRARRRGRWAEAPPAPADARAAAASTDWPPAAGPEAWPNTAVPATSTLAPASTQARRVRGVDPAVDLELGGQSLALDLGPDPFDLRERAGDQLLAAEPRVDRHHQRQVADLEHVVEVRRRRARVDGGARTAVERADAG